jgi:hypothetical protein
MPAPDTDTEDRTALPLTLRDLIGNRKTTEEIAAAIDGTTRSVYNLVEKFKIPFIRVLNKRYYKPEDFAAALTRQEHNVSPRRRGRPREVA